jgi:hypothetical protein
MTIQPGEFWVAEIPFTSGTIAKKRPVLVLWLDGQDAVVATDLLHLGVPRADIVLAFHLPQLRQHTEFAIA